MYPLGDTRKNQSDHLEERKAYVYCKINTSRLTADACTEHAYASVPYAYAQHKLKNSKFENVPSKHAEHTRQELMRELSMRVRTDAHADRTHQFPTRMISLRIRN